MRKSYHLWQHGWPWRHYAQWNNSKTNIVWSHLHVESNRNHFKIPQKGNKICGYKCQDLRGRGIGRKGSKGTNF